jgi:hypothetical protein
VSDGPLHLCAVGHEPFFFHAADCPLCALRRRLEEATARIAQLTDRVATREQEQEKEPT